MSNSLLGFVLGGTALIGFGQLMLILPLIPDRICGQSLAKLQNELVILSFIVFCVALAGAMGVAINQVNYEIMLGVYLTYAFTFGGILVYSKGKKDDSVKVYRQVWLFCMAVTAYGFNEQTFNDTTFWPTVGQTGATCDMSLGVYQNQRDAFEVMSWGLVEIFIAAAILMILSLLSTNAYTRKMWYLLFDSAINAAGAWMIIMGVVIYTCIGKSYVYTDAFAHLLFTICGSMFIVFFVELFLIPLMYQCMRCFRVKPDDLCSVTTYLQNTAV